MYLKNSFLTISFLIVIFYNNKSAASNKINIDSLPEPQKFFDTTTLESNTIDTFNYANLPYWNWHSTLDEENSAYLDTFSVDGCKFRFINPIYKYW